MWWLETRAKLRRPLGFVVVAALAALQAACFQPLYGERSPSAGPSVKTALSQVDIAQIAAPNGTPESRIAVELRNSLSFDINGNNPAPPTHRLNISIASTRMSVIVDITTARPDVENFGLTASYQLVDLRSGQVVLSDQTVSRVSYDIPGQQQRFARTRGLRDAENRAAKVIADNIRTRLASYFIAGT
jgi:LPS-assembly lipoprotein